MEEQHNEQPTPPPSSNKLKIIKGLTLTFIFLLVFFGLGFVGVESTSSSKFCSSCHEMKPQYYTWKASTHSEVDCVSCHIQPGAENFAKAKANGLVEVYMKTTDKYQAPIKMPNLIPDEACERCHNIKTRNFSVSGDLIIPHTKHKEEGIECVQCHSGTAHGEISDRKVTYKSDYGKWNEKLGASLMSDKKFTSPQMDTCMECHELQKAPLECTACHESTMVPDNHKTEQFKAGGHGKDIQAEELQKCEKCHSYMSTSKYDLFKETPTYQRLLDKDKAVPQVTVQTYAKTNTFCRDCHKERPASHKQSHFMSIHGSLSKSTDTCMTCHDNRILAGNKESHPVTSVQCSSCHPSSHNRPWRNSHPIEVAENQKYDKSCNRCHNEKKCMNCHRTSSSTKANQ
ncbi:cytochrome c3 family protein [Neobacillus sp. LXY-4]|uniref:cytochrome c3 family protein n=1 Tax=Neobacillus sp. LXY-4 TaxID=3379826 RepID=UPI003EE2736F